MKTQTQFMTLENPQPPYEHTQRTHTWGYDELGALASASITTDESGTPVTRTFTYVYDRAAGQFRRIGPDGLETFVQLDLAGRISYLRRGPAGAPVVSATLTYLANGLVSSIDYGDLTTETYTYDAANHVTTIHRQGLLGRLLRLDYTYDTRGLPTRIEESSAFSASVVVDFTYDARGRLIHEVRTGNTPYDLAYEYDAGGNRTRKVDALNQREVAYHYDLEDPLRFASANNRLEYAEEFGWVGGVYDLTATTWYYHAHNVTRVVRHEEGSDVYTAVRLGYARNERTVTFAAGERWHWDGNPAHAETGYELTWVRQFRYDSGRSRYLSRRLDPAALQAGQLVVLEDVWSDYDGDDVYADYSVLGGVATTTRAYEPGLATVEDPTGPAGSPRSEYYVTDHLGTTRDRSYLGASQARAVYTAFGEPVSAPTRQERYGYVGAFGYQQHAEFPFLHVGARYYDPSSGRFLQRDPIGIQGGRNVYAYAENLPAVHIDPDGDQYYPGNVAPGADWLPPPPTTTSWYPRMEDQAHGMDTEARASAATLVDNARSATCQGCRQSYNSCCAPPPGRSHRLCEFCFGHRYK